MASIILIILFIIIACGLMGLVIIGLFKLIEIFFDPFIDKPVPSYFRFNSFRKRRIAGANKRTEADQELLNLWLIRHRHIYQGFILALQDITGIDNAAILQAQIRFASLGESEEQVKKMLITAANIAACGLMDFNSAVGFIYDQISVNKK